MGNLSRWLRVGMVGLELEIDDSGKYGGFPAWAGDGGSFGGK